jgi:hypothetical protein
MTLCAVAKLYINGDHVGDVAVQGTEGSWSHGHFRPREEFSKFAPLFGRWSLMMHAGGVYEPLTAAASAELRLVECGIDRLKARLAFEASGTHVACAQLNIDGPLIEWKSMEMVSGHPRAD